MNQYKTIVDVLKSGQIVAWQGHEEGADTYVSIITWNESLTLNLWQGLAGDGFFQNLDCKTLNFDTVNDVRFNVKAAANRWLEEIQAAEEEELNSAPLGLDQEGERFLDEQIAKSDAEERAPRYGDPCPRCDKPLLACSPSGNGNAACDGCQLFWD